MIITSYEKMQYKSEFITSILLDDQNPKKSD